MISPGRVRVILLALADLLCVFIAWAVVVMAYRFLGGWLRAEGVATSIGAYRPSVYLAFWPVPFVFVALNAVFQLYQGSWLYPSAPLSPVEEMRRLFGSSVLTHMGVVAYLGFAYQTTDGFSRFVVVVAGVLVALASQSVRNWMRALMRWLDLGQIPVVLAGDGAAAARVAIVLADDAYYGFRIVGYFAGLQSDDRRQDGLAGFAKLGIPCLGSLKEIVPQAKRLKVKILLACQSERFFRAQLEELASWFTFINYLPTDRTFPVFGARAVSFGGVGGLEMVNQGRMRLKRIQKRVMDMTLAVVAFIFLSPLFLLLTLAVKMTSKGPIFYRQERLGQNGKPFRIWKFRSMHSDADERLRRLLATDPETADEWNRNFKLKCDPRVTLFGRFLRRTSLDELPQLFNVFAGEMALIGPRPIVQDEVRHYGDAYRLFASVKPGVTGLWQVSGRSNTDYARRVALDTSYVLNWSPWMDIWILIRTVYAVLLMRGAR